MAKPIIEEDLANLQFDISNYFQKLDGSAMIFISSHDEDVGFSAVGTPVTIASMIYSAMLSSDMLFDVIGSTIRYFIEEGTEEEKAHMQECLYGDSWIGDDESNVDFVNEVDEYEEVEEDN